MNRIKHINGGRNISCQSFDIYVSEDGGGKLHIGKPVLFEEVPREEICDPTLKLTDEQANKLINDLWVAGYRPSSGVSSTGQIEATNKHLNDMRRIVESKLKVEF
jgi:hypothetical protein